jgi:hypothetical protein
MQHAERICVAYIVAKIDHRRQSMLFDQSADALSLVGDHRWKQLLLCAAALSPFAMPGVLVCCEHLASMPLFAQKPPVSHRIMRGTRAWDTGLEG